MTQNPYFLENVRKVFCLAVFTVWCENERERERERETERDTEKKERWRKERERVR